MPNHSDLKLSRPIKTCSHQEWPERLEREWRSSSVPWPCAVHRAPLWAPMPTLLLYTI